MTRAFQAFKFQCLSVLVMDSETDELYQQTGRVKYIFFLSEE